jgi:hypothetical protein
MIAIILRYWQLVLLAVLLGLIGLQTVRLSHSKGETATARTELAQYRAAAAEQRSLDEAKARTAEQELREHADHIQKESHAKQAALNARVDALRRELRNRPQRPAPGAPSPAAGASAPGGTGSGLYREDAGFLAGEAASAARLATERDACRAQYEDAAERLKRYEAERGAK